MKTVLVVFGTRPEAIKMAPVVRELRSRAEAFHTVVCVTGQHRQMLDQVLSAFSITPEYDLAIMAEQQTLAEMTSRVLIGVDDVLAKEKPDVVLVHGDTTTSFAAALAAFYRQIPVGHVEAGLRTSNMHSPWPEEFNRCAIDLHSDMYFAPTNQARDNLLAEGKPASAILVTGNTAIDALLQTTRAEYSNTNLRWAEDSRLILITAHRRENQGAPMHRMFRAIRRVLEEHPNVKAIYPIHLNPEVRRIAHQELDGLDRFRMIEPLDVVDFHNFMAASHLILTDSGGIQEEAPSLGKPVLVMRETTERPEGIAAGTCELVGTDEDVIYNQFTELLDSPQRYEAMANASNPFGDGHAAARIVDALMPGEQHKGAHGQFA
ncbi:MAG: non-hydrolyzing UDP-N-acetylglucosamine 2-epimerase [Ancrocorticia sp.]|uniref:non-hydrolyzing UDP-N-acetylglucosamine 2-epimerase n=1 Tax=Ancrocorticia sp. TaxID=2593684 RepID=UPI003F8F88B0